jgi:hypothetical protein
VEIRALLPGTELAVYGAALVDPAGTVRQLRSRGRTKYREVYRDTQVAVYQNTTALPRAFVVPQATLAAAPGESLDLLTREPFAPRRQVILAAGSPAALTAAAAGPESASTRLIRDEPGNVTVEAATSGAGYLVVSSSFAPGWQASVDGAPAPVLRGNLLFQTVPLPAGTHTVELRYQPPQLALGATISGLALLLALAGLGGARLPWRRVTRRVGLTPWRWAQGAAWRLTGALSRGWAATRHVDRGLARPSRRSPERPSW